MIANYNVELLPYNSTGSFRFWCQKVLPLVYDNSLSYYELLCKVVQYLNDVIQNSDNMNANIEALNQAFIDLQDYVNHYFDEFNMQQYVNAALDEMVDNGTLQALIEPYLDRLTQTVTDAIEGQNQAIDDAIDAQNQTINDAIGEQNQTIDDAIDEQNAVLERMRDMLTDISARMANLARVYGTQNMTLLFDGSANQANTEYALTDDAVNNYEFLDIYYQLETPMYMNLPNRIEHLRIPAHYANGFVITSTDSKYSELIGASLQHATAKILFGNSVENPYHFTLDNATLWNWNGRSNANASSESNYGYLTIKKIYGVTIDNNTPNEIIDARVGYDNSVYPTLGDAIRGQVTNLANRTNTLESALTSKPNIYHGYTESQANLNTKDVVFVSPSTINNTALNDGDILIIKFTEGNSWVSGDITLSFNEFGDIVIHERSNTFDPYTVFTYIMYNGEAYPIAKYTPNH